jgi:hypothetical protein
VAIAGTITNAATGEIVPLATVRITAAPVAFGEGLLATLAAAAARCPLLGASYSALLAQGGQRADPLATAQILLDRLEGPLALPRPDQTLSGGDGHYCFLDLPPGHYCLTATYTVPDHCHGATAARVEVPASQRGLGFAQLDMALGLEPGAWPLGGAADLDLPGSRWLGPPETPSYSESLVRARAVRHTR